jgi:hypothetical protein
MSESKQFHSKANEAPMQHYRAYKTTNDGHILGPPLVIECQDDQAAIGKAASAITYRIFRTFRIDGFF